MRPLHDSGNTELRRVLEALLADDVEITAREVARRHPTLKNASAFTRTPARRLLIEEARKRQADARNVRLGDAAARSVTLVKQLAEKNRRIDVLEREVAALITSHAACVRAVMQHGGMRALETFWSNYKDISSVVREELNAVPLRASVTKLRPSPHDSDD